MGKLSRMRVATATAAFVMMSGGSASAAPLAIPEVPLFLTTGAEPNVMIMLDNSASMQNIVPDTPYDPNQTYLQTCPSDKTVSTDVTVELGVVGGAPRIRYDRTDYTYGTTDNSHRCFASTSNYLARLQADSNGYTSVYLPAQYTGNYLNWYFNTGKDPTGCSNAWSSGRKPCAQSRIQIARTAGQSLVDSLSSSMRTGLSTYNNGDGGKLLETVGTLDAAKRTALKSTIGGLTAYGNTPLAETLSDIGFYFSRSPSATNLTLHPGNSPQVVSRSSVFKNGYDRDASWNNGPDPVQYSCQRSFGVLLTDGRPNGDRSISSLLTDYDGDCVNASPACLTFDRKTNRQYEPEGSDYLDDVAQALFEIDLRPDLVSDLGIVNNLSTYMISFADDQAINDPLMKSAARQGGGEFYIAGNEAQLTAAFEKALAAIARRSSSAAAAGVNAGSIGSATRIYQAKFDSTSWTGQLLSYPVLDNGTLGNVEWDAAKKIPAPNNRRIITVNSNGMAAPFRWNDLDDGRKLQLDPNYSAASSDLANARLDYLRGADASVAPASVRFRTRTSQLGDIVNSSPVFVGDPQAGYRDTLERKPYSRFRLDTSDPDGPGPRKGRKQVVYAGANDGMLHAFDADGGAELLAFIPGSVFGNLRTLTDPLYVHKFFVDAPPNTGDVYINGAWQTVLVGGLNQGGQGIYALNVTDPSRFSEANAANLLLWEFTDRDIDGATNGFTGDADLGYTYGQPAIVRLRNGKWGAIFGNGYNNTTADDSPSTTGNAVLYIVDIETGQLIKKFDTGVGTAADPLSKSRPNGLATPAAVDINGDSQIDSVFAGDLFGNLWKFDLSSTSSNDWKIAYASGTAPQPLFTALDPTKPALAQPITSRPEVIRGPRGVGMMVLFGTGKYLETTDTMVTANAKEIQSYYGLYDPNSGRDSDRIQNYANLIEQTIIAEQTLSGVNLRATSRNPLKPDSRGWYLNLDTPTDYDGERVISNTTVRSGRAIFTTLIPSPDPCGFGGKSWLMELDALTGGRLSEVPFDVNNDGVFDRNDLLALAGGDSGASGIQLDSGIAPTPGVLMSTDGSKEYKYSPGTNGNISVVVENPGKGASGRQSWRQIR